MSFRHCAACRCLPGAWRNDRCRPPKSKPIRVSASAKAACMPDAMRLCRDAVPNVKNVLLCFGQHREQISNRCRLVLASYGLQ